jgi:hypothetical protein
MAEALCKAGCAAIYSETVSGNPLRAQRVVRWVLNSPGLLGGDRVYDEAEIVFLYSEVFRSYVQNVVRGVLYRPAIDRALFHCDDVDESARQLTCFYIGKSRWRDGVIDRDTAFEITREEPARSELGKLLRHTRLLYCFDNSTMLIYEALLCGCAVVVVPDGTHTRSDYERLELGAQGIGWWPETETQIKSDPRQLEARLAELEVQYEQQVRCVIQAVGFQLDSAGVDRADDCLASLRDISVLRQAWNQMYGCVEVVRDQFRRAERAFRRTRRSIWRRLATSHSETWDILECPVVSEGGPRSLVLFAGDCPRSMAEVLESVHAIAIPTAPRTSPRNIGYLLSRARQFVSFGGPLALEALAVRVGCPVVRVNSDWGVLEFAGILSALVDPSEDPPTSLHELGVRSAHLSGRGGRDA